MVIGRPAKIWPSDDPKWPIYGDLLTLPLAIEPADLVLIKWSEGGLPVTQNYYQMRAWFNRPAPDGVKDPTPEQVNTQYEKAKECLIFVAEEFIHPRYRYGPQMANQHLLNVLTRERLDANGDYKILTLNEALNNEAKTQYYEQGWARLTIDEEFYYGQSASGDRRWLVYHPRREAYQGRFVVDGKQQWLETVAAAIPSVKIAGINITKMDAAKVKALSGMVLRMAGDPLRQFVSPAAIAALDPGTAKKETGLIVDGKSKESSTVLIDESLAKKTLKT